MRKVTVLCAIFILVFAGLSLMISPAYGQIKLNYSNFFPAPHSNAVLSVEWGKAIEKATNGRVQVTVFPGGTLTPANKCYDGVVQGISDVCMTVASYTMGKFPLAEALDLPLGSKLAYNATKIANEFYNKFKPKEFNDVKMMYLMAHGPGIIHTSKTPVIELEDMKGLKIRATGTTAKIVAALGGTPVGMPMPDTYDALSKGVVEGVVCPMEALKGWKLGEVVKYSTQDFTAAYNLVFIIVMNKGKWNSIKPADQKAIEKINKEWIIKSGKNWDKIDQDGIDFIKARGNKIITLSQGELVKFGNAVKPMFDEYIKEKSAMGLPAAAAVKFLQMRVKQLNK
jgi:TRAP-type C4-dicarboxylate transport system substrate-binding protein